MWIRAGGPVGLGVHQGAGRVKAKPTGASRSLDPAGPLEVVAGRPLRGKAPRLSSAREEEEAPREHGSRPGAQAERPPAAPPPPFLLGLFYGAQLAAPLLAMRCHRLLVITDG